MPQQAEEVISLIGYNSKEYPNDKTNDGKTGFK
jgi:hypothetical protein